MMGAVFSEMDEGWAGRRQFNEDPIGRAVEGAAGIIALVAAGNPVVGRKAA